MNNSEATQNDLQEQITELREAKSLLHKAYELLHGVIVIERNDRNAEVYLLEPLQIMMSEDHGFHTNELNIDDLIARYEGNSDNDEAEDAGSARRAEIEGTLDQIAALNAAESDPIEVGHVVKGNNNLKTGIVFSATGSSVSLVWVGDTEIINGLDPLDLTILKDTC